MLGLSYVSNAAFASSKVCGDAKYVVDIYSSTAADSLVSRQWGLAIRASRHSGSMTQIKVNKDRADNTSDRGRALYALAVNAMNNGYKVRLVDNFGKNCASVDEIDVFRMP
jgi:hypothetical protein